jgi:hypothetical protein
MEINKADKNLMFCCSDAPISVHFHVLQHMFITFKYFDKHKRCCLETILSHLYEISLICENMIIYFHWSFVLNILNFVRVAIVATGPIVVIRETIYRNCGGIVAMG